MLLIKNGRVVDPRSGVDRCQDILIKDGKIASPAALQAGQGENPPVRELDAAGCIVAPGLVDMHVHFRDPGFLYKETLETGVRAAAAGGVTTVVCMPNTAPVLDSPAALSDFLRRAQKADITVLAYGAVTLGQKGEALSDAAALKQAGAIGLSDDGQPVMNAALLRAAMRRAKALGLVISSHCEDYNLVRNYAVNEGAVSEKLGIPGRPAIAEELMVMRDIMLAAETGARVHIAHVSTKGAVDIIRRAKAAGAPVTAETCPQYFTLTENEVLAQGAMAKVNPPLRTQADVDAVIQGLIDGTLDAIATDHAPHAAEEKALPLIDAPSGLSGLETSLGLALTALYHTGRLTLSRLIELMSSNPADILGINKGRLGVGDDADLVIFDPDASWTVDPALFLSKGRNTPFAGAVLRGRVRYTVAGGRLIYSAGA